MQFLSDGSDRVVLLMLRVTPPNGAAGACRHESKIATIMVRILVGGVRQRGGGGKRMVADTNFFRKEKIYVRASLRKQMVLRHRDMEVCEALGCRAAWLGERLRLEEALAWNSRGTASKSWMGRISHPGGVWAV